MAKKIYDQKIDKNTDWGGDASTGGLPVAGRRVQEFIKEAIDTRYGFSRVMDEKFLQQFAGEAEARLYDTDPDRYGDLLLNSIQLPGSGESVAIMRVSVLAAPAEYTTAGVEEVFRFRYLSYYGDETDLSPVRGEAVFTVNGTERGRMELRAGSTYSFDATKYLTSERNTVQVTITNNEGSTRNFVYDVNIVNIGLTSSFDDTAAYPDVIAFRYTPIGNILKTVHFILDGREIHTEQTLANNRQLSFDIPAQTHGAHSLSVYITADVMGSQIRTATLSYDVICIKEGNKTPVIASAFAPGTVAQYETINIPFVVYDPAGTPAVVRLFVNGAQISERSVDRTRQVWTYRADVKGNISLKIQCGSTSTEFTFEVTESVVTSIAETQDLELYLTSQGRSNQDTNRQTWAYGNVATVFSGMNWATNGWISDDAGSTALRLSGGATATIPLKMFGGNIRQTGKTIELEFSVRDVTDYNATIASCLSGGIGMKLTPNTISLVSEQSRVEMRYKEEERVRVTFVIEKQADNRLMQIYVNGIKSQSFQYPATDGFTQSAPVDITIGSPNATIDLYNIRVYANNLRAGQLLDNYIADMDDIDRKVAVFERNRVFDSYGSLSMTALNRQIPVMVITGTLPSYKGDKKTVSIQYTDLRNPAKSFTAEGCSIDVQGTSSQYYPRKNFKFTAKNGFEMTQGGHADAFTLNEAECLPTTVFCTKTDFAESSGTHNTGMANYIDWLTKQMGLLTPRQEANPIVRTTVYGEPCVIFHKATEDAIEEFYGKFNFNTDKGADPDTTGFREGDESWEYLNNTSEVALFKTANLADWGDTLEARFPEDYENIAKVQRLYDWIVACKGNPEKFAAEAGQYFDKRQIVFYYLLTLTFGMVDQRAKNQFLTTFGGEWMFILYDNDTCMGINNEGGLAFSYNIEIHDVIGSLAVWNGADSELWKLVETAFADDIRQMYYDLRQRGLLSYEKIIEYTNTRQSDRWCEAVYNEDGYFKYEKTLIEGFEDWSSGSPVMTRTGAYLYALQGSRDAHRRWWLFNRMKYLDSKFQAGSSLSDYATFRTYTPSQWEGVAPNADITIRTFAAMYGAIKWGSVTRTERMDEGETRTIAAPTGMTFNDTETIVYNASMIASLGDLSPLYPGTVDVSRMKNLTELVIGSPVEGYRNTNFTVLSVGTNRVLRRLDIRNCPNFTANIEVSACEAIEEIYAAGTGTTAANLPEGGSLRVLQLPATVTNLTLKNQPKLTDDGLQLAGVGNLAEVVVENTPGVDGYDLAKRCLTGGRLARVRLIDIDATDNNLNVLKAMASLRGIDEAGEITDTAIVTGRLHANTVFTDDVSAMAVRFPDLTITYNNTMPKPPVRTIVVGDVDTKIGIPGATVTINGIDHTTDENGKVFIEGPAGFSITVTAAGYARKTVTLASITGNKTDTVYLDPEVMFTLKAIDQNGSGIQGVEVTCNNEIKMTGASGTATFAVSRGYRDWSATYLTQIRTGYVTMAQADVLVETSFTRPVEDYLPTPNGNIQMLVRRQSTSNSYVILQISSSTTDYIIDWGDGEISPAIGTGQVSYTHTYLDGGYYNIEVKNCENVTACNVDSEYRGCLLAYWTIGNSKVCNLRFNMNSSFQFVGADIFKNDTERTSFSGCFSYASLSSIPEGLFRDCPKASSFSSCFSNSRLTSIPEGLFDNNPLVTDFSQCFNRCNVLTSIPEGLFDNNTRAPYVYMYACFSDSSNLTHGVMPFLTDLIQSNWNRLYANCASLAVIIAPQETPQSISADTFLNSGTSVPGGFKIYVPDASIAAYKAATNWSQYASQIYPMSQLPPEE